MINRTVTILCSGFGLGFYIPGLLAGYQLRQRGINTETLVFESFIQEEKKQKIIESRDSYHKNFGVALVATRMPIDIRESIDKEKINALLDFWEEEGRYDFISLSGHWGYILDEYRERMAPRKLNVDLLYVDSDFSPSWKGLKKYNPDYNKHYTDLWLYDFEKKSVNYRLVASHDEPIPYSKREPRFVVHGGGWGMGTYRSKIAELNNKGFLLDIVAYQMDEIEYGKDANRYFINDPDWAAWNKNKDGFHDFPPYSQMKEEEKPVFTNKEENHWLYDVTKYAKGIISKPGAGTLIDSLSSATPIIMLEPFGQHEKRNLELWEYLGYGISYEKWRETDYSLKILETLSENILDTRDNGVDYIDGYIQRVGACRQDA